MLGIPVHVYDNFISSIEMCLIILSIYVALTVFQSYRDLEVGSRYEIPEIVVVGSGFKPFKSSASQKIVHHTTAGPRIYRGLLIIRKMRTYLEMKFASTRRINVSPKWDGTMCPEE